MKKLLFIFVAFFTLTLLNGCDDQGKTTRFDEKGQPINNESETAKDPEASTSDDSKATTPEDNKTQGESQTISTTSNLSLTSVKGNELSTNLNYNVIRGKVSKNTHSIQVNGYKLKKYVPGQTAWSYIAASRLGTLKNGKNNYEVKTYAKNGQELQSLNFSVNYDEKAIPELPTVGASAWVSLLMTMMVTAGYFMIRKYKS